MYSCDIKAEFSASLAYSSLQCHMKLMKSIFGETMILFQDSLNRKYLLCIILL